MSLNKKIKVTFILPTLFAGGSERIVSFIAQNINKDTFDSTLIIIGHKKDSAYNVKDIKVIFLEKSRVLNGIIPLIRHLKSIKPDIVLSVIGHLNTVTAYISYLFPKSKFIAREATILSNDATLFGYKKKRFNLFYTLSQNRFNRFDKIICQSKDMLFDLKQHYNVKDKKLIIINNPITSNFKCKKEISNNNKREFITIARLSKEKGVPRILKILSKLNFDFNYTLIGEGPENGHVKYLIEKYELTEKVTQIPFTNDVFTYLAKSDYFLQGSFFEGFPNALLESCVAGTPVIAFNVPGGSKEIVENGTNGFLVDSDKEFIERLKHTRDWDPNTINESVYKKFNKKKILGDYEHLFLDILK